MKKNLFILIMLLSLLVSCVVYGAGFGSDSKFAVIDLNQIKQESLAIKGWKRMKTRRNWKSIRVRS